MSKLAVASGASSPNGQMTELPALIHPAARTHLVCAGTTSLTVPPLEVDGPLLVTTRWKVRSVPATTVSGALLAIARSACVCTVLLVVLLVSLAHSLSLHDALPISVAVS